MRGVLASVVVATPLVWAVSSLGAVAALVTTVLATGISALLLAKESIRVEALEVELAVQRSRVEGLEAGFQTEREVRLHVDAELLTERGRLEAALARAQGLKASLDEARSSRAAFLATVSHELRTPLHAVIGFTELVSDGSAGPVTSQQREYLGDARAAAQHLLRLITDVLDYAKADAGRLSFATEAVQVAPVLDEVTALLDGLATKKRLSLVTSCEDGLTLWGDGLRVKQVLLNLVGNAVKFTPPGGRIELSARSSQGVCELAVRDSGVGIASEDVDRIFEPFQQADSSTARQHSGTGLGLALVKRWTEAMGGAVELKSQLGEGSCFTVTLPRESKLTELRRPEVKAGPEVLVAEDDDATRTMLARVLEAHGCRVRTAVNGQRALEQVMAQVPEAVVLDLMMPELDGLALLEKLRSLPRGEAVPVLVFSAANPRGADRERLIALGAEVLLKGSLTPTELAQRIHAVVRPTRSAA